MWVYKNVTFVFLILPFHSIISMHMHESDICAIHMHTRMLVAPSYLEYSSTDIDGAPIQKVVNDGNS
jgi:hypothetical protein